MIVKRIEGATRVLGAPPDWKDNGDACQGLPIVDVVTDQGMYMVSAWEPSPEELLALMNGASLRLWIRGTSHPVVCLDVAP